MAAISKDAKRIARLTKENGMYDPDSESLFIANPAISFGETNIFIIFASDNVTKCKET